MSPDTTPLSEASTLDELLQIADGMDSSPLKPLSVVRAAGVVCHALSTGIPMGTQSVRNPGFQQFSWTEDEMRYSWSRSCWRGDPAFPGDEEFGQCQEYLGPEQEPSCAHVVQTARDVLGAFAEQDGSTVLWAKVQNFGDELHLQLWVGEENGSVWYWQWDESYNEPDVPL